MRLGICSVYFRRVCRVHYDGVGFEETQELQEGVWQGVSAKEGYMAICVVEILINHIYVWSHCRIQLIFACGPIA